MNRTIDRIGLFCLLGCLHLFVTRLDAATTLINYNSLCRYFDGGYEPSPFWAQREFDDAEWYYGFGQFGYGDGDESTSVSYGVDDEHKFVTTYFRAHVFLDEPSSFSSMTLNLIRDDGAVVYVNGAEVFRDNMPLGDISYFTYALTGLVFPDENSAISFGISPSLFVEGDNVIAVEVHQFEPASPDLSFDLELVGETGGGGTASVLRGPYLQVGTSSNIIVRWRTSSATDSRVRFGTTAGSLNLSADNNLLVTDHEVVLNGLLPDTEYYYDIGTTAAALAGDASYHFITAPVPGTPKPTRIWAIGDFGTGFFQQHGVRNAYANFTSGRHTDVWLMLGDNAYYSGLDYEYQFYCFDIYPTQFRQWVVWPTVGNHETGQSQVLSDNYDYYRIFTMPTMGQAGGVASGTEHYYSFDYANIHFVCLDSETAIFRQPNSAMAQWLKTDLADNTRDWVIVYFHHPPYTFGSHNSETESDLYQVRQNILPILETYGADLVLSGHSHVYERSYLIDGQYGFTNSVNATNFVNHGDGRTNGNGAYLKPAGGMGARRGTVYIVDGSSGGQGGGGTLNHPVMSYSTLAYGSLVIDVTGQRLDGAFLTDSGATNDTFTILKDAYPGVPQPTMHIARAGTNAVISWPTSLPDYQLESKPLVDGPTWTPVGGTLSTNGRRKGVTVPPVGGQKYFHLRSIP